MIRSWRVVCVVRWVWRLVTAVAMVGLALYALISVWTPASARWTGFEPTSVAVEMGAGGQPHVLRLHGATVVADLGSLLGYQVAPVPDGYDVTLYLRR